MKSALGSAREWAVPALPTHPFGRRVPTRGSTMRVGVFFRRGAATRVRSADALGGSRGRRSAPRSIARLPVACAGDSQYHRVTVRGRRAWPAGSCRRPWSVCAPAWDVRTPARRRTRPEEGQTWRGCGGYASGFAAAAARAAAGSASRMRDTAASSYAAETNHASYGDGGRKTPPSSIAWKNGG